MLTTAVLTRLLTTAQWRKLNSDEADSLEASRRTDRIAHEGGYRLLLDTTEDDEPRLNVWNSQGDNWTITLSEECWEFDPGPQHDEYLA